MKPCSATRKRRHRSESLAIQAAAKLDAKDAGHRPVNVWRCTFCGDFHIGHRPVVLPVPSVPPPVPAKSTKEPCGCQPCRKAAVASVQTPHGPKRVCQSHARRLTEVYEQRPEC